MVESMVIAHRNKIIASILVVLGIMMVSSIISIIFIEKKRAVESILWIVLVLLLPPIGIFLYFIFGSTLTIKRTYRARNNKFVDEMSVALKEKLENMKARHNKIEDSGDTVFREVMTFNERYANAFLTQHNKVDIFTNGKDMFSSLFADLRSAKETIHIVFYGIHLDELGIEFKNILTQCALKGVEVKVLYDTLGSFGTNRRKFRQLHEAGGKTKGIKPLLTHFRNHRKIVVIDGKIGYTGGMNIGTQYLGMVEIKSPWRDTHIRIEGDAVNGLQYYFFYDWFYANKPKDIDITIDYLEKSFPEHHITDVLPCQVLGSGVDTTDEYINRSYLRMISSARKNIRLQSPYFVPNETILQALQVAASTGVEVELMLPRCAASFFLEPTADFYLDEVIDYGVKVFYYDGYIHAKTLSIDDKVVCIGSVNLDVRSLEVDDEICAIFLDEAFGKRHRAIFEEDRKNSKEMDYDAFRKRPLRKKAKERLFALFAPLM